MFDPASLATSMIFSGGKQLKDSISGDFNEEIPTMDVGLGGGADLSALRDAEYSQSMGYWDSVGQGAANVLSGGTLGYAATAIEYFKKKKAEKAFYDRKQNAMRQGLYMNSIGDYRDYQRRGLAESASSQMNRYIDGLMSTY